MARLREEYNTENLYEQRLTRHFQRSNHSKEVTVLPKIKNMITHVWLDSFDLSYQVSEISAAELSAFSWT